jgi:hypothetical protein
MVEYRLPVPSVRKGLLFTSIDNLNHSRTFAWCSVKKLEKAKFVFRDTPPSIIITNRKVASCPHCGNGVRRVGLKGSALKSFASDLGATVQRVFECPNCHLDLWVYPRKVDLSCLFEKRKREF